MSNARRDRWLAINFAVTIFVSAFLLFQVQPLVSKYILPWFGGSPAVWTTCMLFFQLLLFGGYAYAHLSQRFLSPRLQGLVHLGLIVLALVMLRVVPSESWKPTDSSDPVGHILLLLAATVGVPYFVLSSTGPLIQAWFARAFPGRIPYRLYSLSNVGSLLALLSYPFLFERVWDVPRQASFWSWGFVVYAALCTYAAISVWMLLRGKPSEVLPVEGEAAGLELAPDGGNENAAEDSWWRRGFWLALPAFASLTLLATTNHVSIDVAPVPFLWVVSLSLYLLTFIIAFDHSSRYQPGVFSAIAVVSIYLAAMVYFSGMSDINLFECGTPGKALHVLSNAWWRFRGVEQVPTVLNLTLGYVIYVALMFGVMFWICMLCHGELVRLRPHPRHLTAYYLMISAGGALGGLTATLLAPLVFKTYFEFDLSLIFGYVLAIAILVRSVYRYGSKPTEGKSWWRRTVSAAGLLLLLMAGIGLCDFPQYFDNTSVHRVLAVRNFFGTLSVLKQDTDNIGDAIFTLKHGGIIHGVQYTDAERRYKPTTYYSVDSGVGRTIGYFRQHGSKDGLKVGAVGLGTGTLAAYIDKGDSIRFYEINPAVIEISEPGNWFTYLEDCKDRGGNYQIKLGDARLTLERELKEKEPQHFQVLVLDAFSGDAIPMHLLTEEAFRIYLDHLAEDGAIAVHITNRYLDLEPVARGAAEKFNLQEMLIKNAGESRNGIQRADWIILTRNNKLVEALASSAEKPKENPRPAVLWTDSRSNMFDLLK